MLTRLDHLVILVSDLAEAVEDYGRRGFTVTPGGEHADGLTRNALIPFRDGSYLELVVFVDPDDPRDNVWGWRNFVAEDLPGGLVDYCAATDDIEVAVRVLRERGFDVSGPDDGGRRLPDGTEIRWRSARITTQEGRALPFLIQDVTPRGRRVPGGPAARHPNGARGISRLEVSVGEADRAADGDVARSAERYAVLMGTPAAPGPSFRLGACEVALVAAGREAGPGPLGAELDVGGAKAVRLPAR